jgi:DNA-binding CsgD family transcriptional regulator
VRRFDSVRLRGRHTDPIAGLGRHHPLVDARWTLVDAYERGGARYIVARENQADVRGLARLTDRERQVVAFLALGRSTKEIAYSLGISDSTTRVLLSRAAVRLGARTRQELVRLATREAFPDLAGLEATEPAPLPAPNGKGRPQGEGTGGSTGD